MTIQNIVNYLLKNGFTQQTLADKLTACGVLTAQSTIHRISREEGYQPGADKTLALVALHSELIKSESASNENHPNGGNAK